jgi:hypothetical protein
MLNFIFSSIAHKVPSVVTLKADLFENYFGKGRRWLQPKSERRKYRLKKPRGELSRIRCPSFFSLLP